MRRMGKLCGVGLLGLVVTGMPLWGMGALSYAPLPTPLRGVLAVAFGLATAGAFLGLAHRRRTLLGFVLVWGALVGWWSTITPSNDRDWQPDVAVLPSATVDGDRVTLHNIRNIAYRTATDFTPRYYDKTFDLRRLESVDLISSYWAGETIAHLFGSFGFGGQEYVAISAVDLKRLSHINARAQAAGDELDFSQRIRAGLPMPPQPAGEPVETSRRRRSAGFQFPCSAVLSPPGDMLSYGATLPMGIMEAVYAPLIPKPLPGYVAPHALAGTGETGRAGTPGRAGPDCGNRTAAQGPCA
jgi:hypothetical protein